MALFLPFFAAFWLFTALGHFPYVRGPAFFAVSPSFPFFLRFYEQPGAFRLPLCGTYLG